MDSTLKALGESNLEKTKEEEKIKEIGQYKLLKIIGKGTFGSVYLG